MAYGRSIEAGCVADYHSPMRNESSTWGQRITVLVVFVGVMWLVRGVDVLLSHGWMAAEYGIIPRTWGGLAGIITAPFIHASFEHLLSNTVPLLVLGALILLRGVPEFLFVTGASMLIGGFGTWLFGGRGAHIGASGVVFGYFGYLVFRTVFDRRISSAVVTLAVAALYASAMAWSLIPAAGISWSGHFFGFVGGVIAARLRYPGSLLHEAPANGPSIDPAPMDLLKPPPPPNWPRTR
jgi:membrane associated rhomboid family serine protease